MFLTIIQILPQKYLSNKKYLAVSDFNKKFYRLKSYVNSLVWLAWIILKYWFDCSMDAVQYVLKHFEIVQASFEKEKRFDSEAWSIDGFIR